MKKVSLILLLVILTSVFLMAASPIKLVRIEFINKSGHVVYIKLEGKSQDNFYYLTVPKGTKEIPESETFTIVTDVYTRTTWYGPGDLACEGVKSSGELWATKQAKFVFVPCDQMPESLKFVDLNGEPYAPAPGTCTFDPIVVAPVYPDDCLVDKFTNNGEPSWGEKIVYFKAVITSAGWLGCSATIKTKTYKTPTGSCAYLWKY